MGRNLMGGYAAYTNAHRIVSEANSGSTERDMQSISVTVSVTVSWTAVREN